MNVASLENCKRLYELSGWNPRTNWWFADGTIGEQKLLLKRTDEVGPAYDLGYLLRKLPLGESINLFMYRSKGGGWLIQWPGRNISGGGTTIEDAVCLLVIQLIEQHIIEGGKK